MSFTSLMPVFAMPRNVFLLLLRYFICLQLCAPATWAQADLVPYASGLKPFKNPVGVVKAPGLPNDLFIVQQRGKVYRIKDSPESVTKVMVMDLGSKVSQEGSETGLLGIAFHPEFARNGRLFVSYTAGQGKRMQSHIAELRVADPKRPVLLSPVPKVLISTAQPFENHNGGAIAFGPDGFLYFSWGDGGAGGDPHGNGQNINTLLGKINRIDVDRSDKNKPYGIPADNPFIRIPDARPEIYAYGLRNVWGMHFDTQSGKLWAGDVGQNAHEEIDVVERGGNYGWNIKEGFADFKPNGTEKVLVAPVWSYPQTAGDKSVTGGLVYHGSHKPWSGHYIYGDFMTGRIWALHTTTHENKLLVDRKRKEIQISSFGSNLKGEVLVCSYSDGKIYVLKP